MMAFLLLVRQYSGITGFQMLLWQWLNNILTLPSRRDLWLSVVLCYSDLAGLSFHVDHSRRNLVTVHLVGIATRN